MLFKSLQKLSSVLAQQLQDCQRVIEDLPATDGLVSHADDAPMPSSGEHGITLQAQESEKLLERLYDLHAIMTRAALSSGLNVSRDVKR